MIFNFPQKNQSYTYLQTNRGDDLGSLWSSFNLEFQNNLGTMQLGTKMEVNTSTEDDADLGLPVAFKYFDARMWAICGTRVFKNTGAPITAYVEDASTGASTAYSADVSDLEVFNGELVATGTSNIFTKASNGAGTGAWTSRGVVGAGQSHKLAYFKKFNRIYWLAAGQQVRSADTAWTIATSGDYFLSLQNSIGVVSTLVATSQSLWIGTVRLYNSAAGDNSIARASIFEWDGISAQPTQEYKIDAQGIVAMAVDDDIPYAIDSNGVLLEFTGSSFKEIGRLPLTKDLLNNATYSENTRFIHPNGLISTKNATFKVLVGNIIGNSATSIPENLASGIWEFSTDFGFTHNSSLNYKTKNSSTVTDFGQNKISLAGALVNSNLYSNSSSGRSTLTCGATYFTDASTTTNAIFIDAPIGIAAGSTEGQKKGYFITSWINSVEVEDKWTRLWAVYKKFLSATDSMVFKYRLYEEDPIYATITWVSNQVFTTTTDVTAYGPTASGFNGTSGGEVEIIQGQGSGSCTHIASITFLAGTYTVMLDNPILTSGSPTGTAKARFQKWIKLFPEITGQVKSWEQMAIGANNPRCQIKGCLTFTDGDTNINEFHKMAIFSNSDIKITA